MAELKVIQNGIKKSSNGKRRKRRSNPTTATKSVKRRSNGTTKAGALSYAKKNGLKLTKVSNGRKHHKRKRRSKRNGITAIRSRSNGIFGDTTSMVKKTLTLTGGAVVTNIGGNWLASFLAPYLSSFGLGAYTNLVVQFLVAYFGVPELAKVIKQDKDMARLGGMLSVTLTALNQFFPQFSGINPFGGGGAIVVNSNGGVALTGDAVKAVAAAAAQDTAAKIAGFADQMQYASAGQPVHHIAGSNF
jgi:hypothetical protein